MNFVLQMPQKILSLTLNHSLPFSLYTAAELNAMKLINDHRVSVGLNALQINYVSLKSEEHDQYMITKNVVSHDGFVKI
jgi:hypothetical protein